jgi:putative heme-binding domain-containing protein
VANLQSALVEVAGRQQVDEETRLNALSALATTGELDASLVRFVVTQLQPQHPIERRLRAADILATAKLADAEMNLVLEQVRQLGPMELGRLLPMFAEISDESIGQRLLAALRDNPSIAGVPIPTIKANTAKFAVGVQQEAAKLFAQLDAEVAIQQAFFEQLLTTLEEGDIRRGQAVFYGRKAACSSCHAIGYLGGDIGPDLTRIAQIRAPRDLLEAIVFPSASFVRSYEPVVVVTVNGQIFNGVVRQDAAEQIVIATGADKFETIARDEIEEIHPGKMSVMPAGLDKQLTRQELADLMAFLKASK